MLLFKVTALCLVTIATARDDDGFLIVAKERKGLDLEKMENESDIAEKAFENIDQTGSGLSDLKRIPAAYKEALENGGDLFEKPAITEIEDGAVDASTRQIQPQCIAPGYYQCPHTTYLLNWFFISRREVCFVPWPALQRVTYARCRCVYCNTYWGRGTCRASCLEPRRMLVYCYNFSTGNTWTWRWVVRYLPQACVCSN